jgi:hypothetical protein
MEREAAEREGGVAQARRTGAPAEAGRAPHPLLRMQRTHGNAFVQRWVEGRVQREPAPEAERAAFAAAQDRFFAAWGREAEESIFAAAGLAPGGRPTSPDQALQVARAWGVSLADIETRMPAIASSTATRAQGRTSSDTLDQQQQNAIAAMNPAGQAAYAQMMSLVRAEPFWARHLAASQVYIVPDLRRGRYGGYTQQGRGPDGEVVAVVHLDAERLENGDAQRSAATVIHELSHVIYDPSVTDRALAPLRAELSGLIADHPRLQAIRAGAADPAAERDRQVRLISQILYEATGYAEEEVFVHLQQLTHMPRSIQVGSDTVTGTDIVLIEVEGYLRQLRRIGLPPRLLEGVVRQLRRRTRLLYERRIAALPAGSRERRIMELNRDQADNILDLGWQFSAQPPGAQP